MRHAPSMRQKLLSRVISIGLMSSLIPLVAALPVTAFAQQTATVAYDLSSQSLGSSLTRIASEAGIALSFNPSLTQGKVHPALKGNYTPQQALSQLLQGSGLALVKKADNTWTLETTAAGVLPAVEVNAAGVNADSTSWGADQVSWGKGQTLRETPQSISVLTGQRLRDQNLTTVEDALKQTTGVTITNISSIQTAFYSRGYEITNIQLDGGASLYRGYGMATLPDMAQFEQMEVLRGADGLFSGAGKPGGSLNLVRKRPTREFQSNVLFSAAEWDRYRTELDVSGGLFADGAVRGRAVLAYEDGDTFEKVAHNEKTMFYGIVEFDLSDSTLLTLGGTYDDRDQPYTAFGLPRFSDGRDLKLPRNTYIAPSWATYDTRIDTLFLQLKQQINQDWEVTLDVVDTSQKNDRMGLNFASTVNPVTFSAGASTATRYRYSSDQTSADITVKGKVEWWGREHELLLDGNWLDVRSTSYGEQTLERYAINNIYTFTPYDFEKPADSAFLPFFQQPKYGTEQNGFYAAGRFSLTDALKFIAGARVSNFEYRYYYQPLNLDGSVASTTNNYYEDKDIVTPYAGLVYTLNDQWSLYSSIGEAWESQASRLKGPLPGNALDPITGRNYEAGIKGAFADGKLNTYFSLYRIERNGEAIRDDDYPVTPGDLGSNCCWLDDGKAVSQGVDTEISGEITPDWWVSVGYTWNDNETKRGGSGRFSKATPEHLLKVYTSWRLPAALSDWRVGGGVTAQGENYSSGSVRIYDANGQPAATTTPYDFTQSGYAVWNTFVEYRLHPQWTAMLNVNNVFDKTYYATVGNSAYYNFYGEPRNVGLTVRGHF